MAQRHNTNKLLLVVVGTLLSMLAISPAVTAGQTTALHTAAQRGDLPALKNLASDKALLNVQDADGWTALMYATRGGHLKQVALLLNAGALPKIADKLSRTPLELATRVEAGITRKLIQAGADVNARNAGGIPVIMIAAGEGRQDLVEMLLDAGARLDYKDYQGNNILDWAKRSKNSQLTAYLTPRLKQAVAAAPKESGEDFAEDFFADAVHPEWFKPSYLELNEDLKEALEDGKKGLMVYFGLKRCSYCQAFMDNTLSQQDIASRLQGMFDAVGMSIFNDNEMTDPTGKAYIVKDFVTVKKANYSPTMIFYGKGGRELLKIVGYYPPNKFRRVLDYLEGQHYERETLYTYMNRHKQNTGLLKTAIRYDREVFPNTNYNLNRKRKLGKRPLLVFFEQPDCVACDRFHKRVLTDMPVRRLLGQFDTLQLDATDNKTEIITPDGNRITPKIWHYRLGLDYSPSMVFFNESGNEITRLDSEVKRWRMEGTLQLILEKSYTYDTQVQRWRRDKAVMFYRQQEARQ